jgi:hypothetical protein
VWAGYAGQPRFAAAVRTAAFVVFGESFGATQLAGGALDLLGCVSS